MGPQLLFFLAALVLIPFLPFLIWQGKRLRASIPDLPEADGPYEGLEGQGEKRLQIVVLGESTMAGVGVQTQKDGITRQIAQKLSAHTGKQVQWKVIAKSGYNARQVRTLLVPQLPKQALDLIAIGLSVNDTVERNSPLGWKRDLLDLIKAIRRIQPDCPIVLIHRGPVEFFPAFPRTFQLILGGLIKLQWQAIAALPDQLDQFYIIKRVIHFEDWVQKVDFPVQPDDFFSDGVHPSKMTYRLWAEEVVEFITAEKIL